MVVKLPGPQNLSDPTSGRSGSIIAHYDVSPIKEGYDELGRGIRQMGSAIASIGDNIGQLDEQKRAEQEKTARFNTQVGLLKTGSDLQTALDEAKKTAQPGAEGFAKGFIGGVVDKKYDDFIKTVPEPLRQDATIRFMGLKERLREDANTFEQGEAKRVSDNTVEDGAGKILSSLQANPDSHDAADKNAKELFDTAPHSSPIEADERFRKWKEVSGKTIVQARKNIYGPDVAGRGLVEGDGDLLKHFEGFRSKPYWDTNHWRGGYGSDTYTDANGNSHPVTKDSVISREDADRDLAKRKGIAQQGIIGKVGQEAWNRLNPAQKEALTSVAYNYGSLPDRVVPAVRSGDAGAMSQAVARLGMDNGGINRSRRAQEAALISGRQSFSGSGVAPEYAGIPPQERQKLYDDLTNDSIRQQKDAYDFQLNGLLTGIHDGNMGQTDLDAARQAGWLTDIGDIQKVEKGIKDYQEETGSVNSVMQRIAAGNGSFDPTDGSDDRKAVDKIWDKSVAPLGLTQGDGSAVTAMNMLWRRTGILPKGAKGEILGMIRSTDPAKITTGLSYIDGLEHDNSPAFRSTFDGDTEAQLAQFRTGMQYNNVQEVVDRIKQSNDPEFTKVVAARKKEMEQGHVLDKMTFEKDIRPLFESAYGKRFWSMGMVEGMGTSIMPNQQAAALEDFKDLVAEQYTKTGDLNKAKEEAASRFARVWGPSNANSGRFMKRPPEYYYGPVDIANPHAYMGDQIRQQLEADGHVTKETVGPNIGTAFRQYDSTLYPEYALRADRITDADISAGRPASYELWVVNKDGGVEPSALGADGKPKRFVFDETRAKQDFESQNRTLQTKVQETRKEISDQLGQIPSLNPNLKIPEGEPLPVNMTTFASTLFGSKSDITENDFSSSDKQTLVDTVKRVKAKTGKTEGVIGYGDYSPDGKVSDFGTGMSAGKIVGQSFNNPAFRLETTLGMARYKIEKGNLIITDVYDWYANKGKVNQAVQQQGGPLGLMAVGYQSRGWEGLLNAIGSMSAAKGSGRKVRINLGPVD